MAKETTFRIMSHDWAIVEAPTISISHGLMGECNAIEGKITLQENMKPAIRAETVLHELLHACYFHADLRNVDSPSEEQFVSAISKVLYHALKENPQLVKEITK